MKHVAPVAALALLSACSATPPPASVAPPAADDPYLALEEIEGTAALAKVEEWNARTAAALTGPAFERDRAEAREILDDEAQIALPSQVFGDKVTNLWRDAAHPRGLWRQASLASFVAGSPQWETLIDVDALGKAEGQSWVWHGAQCLPPANDRCLVSLSPGGTDADVVREWDRTTRSFVSGGFVIPAAKNSATWVDRDTLLVGTDWGAGTATDSGYPRILKQWRRGTPLASATTVMEGTAKDIAVRASAQSDGATRHVFVRVGTGFYENRVWLRRADGTLVRTPQPETADIRGVLGGRLIVFLNKPLGSFAGGFGGRRTRWPRSLPGRARRRASCSRPRAGRRCRTWRPATTRYGSPCSTMWRARSWCCALRRLAGHRRSPRCLPMPRSRSPRSPKGRTPPSPPCKALPYPPLCMRSNRAARRKRLQSLPARFDADKVTVEQHFATSKDGTRIPYFIARRKGAAAPAAALIHAYGGFRVAQTPTYLTTEPYRAGPLAKWWVDDGQVYVLANIRGGGEYGPAWHEGAMREKHQNAFDDLYAVAEDLVARGHHHQGADRRLGSFERRHRSPAPRSPSGPTCSARRSSARRCST